MNAVEHIVAWIESSKPHYDRLIHLSRFRRTSANNALAAMRAARGGDAWASEHSPATILDAARALFDWRLEP